MSKTVKTRIQNKIDTAANWAKATAFVPLRGEIIIYSDLKKMKIGDGTTIISSLPFADAELASKLGSSTVGSTALPIYLNNGIPTAAANVGTVKSVTVKMNGETRGTVTDSGTIDLGTLAEFYYDEL